MCVAIPGVVTSLGEGKAQINFNGNKVNAMTGLVNVKVGDYCLVHAGCVIEVLKQKQAEEIISLMKEMDEAINEGN